MNIQENFEPILTCPWRMEWNLCGANGRLTLPGLCNLIAITAGEHATRGGIGYKDMALHNQMWVLNKLYVHISELPKWMETIEISTWVHNITPMFSARFFSIAHNGEVIGKASSMWACLNMEKRSIEHLFFDPSLWPAVQRPELEAGPAPKIPLPKQCETIGKHRIRFSDLDALGHVTNTKYPEWIIDRLPLEKALGLNRCEVEVNFLSELHWDEEVLIEKGVGTPKDTYCIRRKDSDKPSFAMTITEWE